MFELMFDLRLCLWTFYFIVKNKATQKVAFFFFTPTYQKKRNTKIIMVLL